MRTIRIFFEKKSTAKYISHLDITRCMQRALKRAKIPLWYTEGFNPHLYMTFALPLALGYESMRESMDVRLMEDMSFDEIITRVNNVLPNGLKVLEIREGGMKPALIAWADYDVVFSCENVSSDELLNKWNEFMSADSIDVEKKSKKGFKTIDIKPMIKVLSAEKNGEKCLKLKLRLVSGTTQNINPSLVLKAFFEQFKLTGDEITVMRTAILTETFENFN